MNKNIKSKRYSLALLIGALSVNLIPHANATTYLSLSETNRLAKAIISTDETDILSGPYRLRAKFDDGTDYGFHAATTYQNNGLPLDVLPAPMTAYTVELYSLTYSDYTYTDLLAEGPQSYVTIEVYWNFAFEIDYDDGVFDTFIGQCFPLNDDEVSFNVFCNGTGYGPTTSPSIEQSDCGFNSCSLGFTCTTSQGTYSTGGSYSGAMDGGNYGYN